MLRNELFKYKLIRYKLVQHTLSTLYLCALWISLSVLNALSTPVVHASSRCADLVSSSSKEQSVPTSKEQSAQAHFGSGSESTFYGENVPPLPSSSSKNSFGSSSSNVFEPSLTSNALEFSSMNTLDFYSNFSNFSNSKTPTEITKGFQSYIGELLEKKVIGDPELIRFIEHLEKGELINPITTDEALTSTSLLVQRKGLQKYLNKSSLDQKELLAWSRATLEKRARIRVKREEVREETREIPQKLEFHPVKRPVRFEIRHRGMKNGKQLIALTHPIEVQSTPVTQEQWVEIMGENPSHFAKGEDSEVGSYGKGIELQPDNPVENVTWWSVLVFANRLSEEHGFPPAYDLSGITWDINTRPEDGTLMPTKFIESRWKTMKRSTEDPRMVQDNSVKIYVKGESHDPYEGDIYYQAEGYRLPTLAEQAYMLQGGGNIKSDNFFKNKTDLQDYAWYEDNADERTHPVGLLRPIVIDGKEFHEIYGNVQEWAWDRYYYEFRLDEQNPMVSLTIDDVERQSNGGGWKATLEAFLSGSGLNNGYSYSRPYWSFEDVGFRLVRTIERGHGEPGDGE